MDIQSKFEKIVAWWRSADLGAEEDIVEKLYNFRILFAYNSNKIENSSATYHDTREIFENGKVINYTGDLRTLYEIQNQKNAFEFLLSHIVKKNLLSSELVLQIHKKLMAGCYDERRYAKGERPGTYKLGDYSIGDDIGSFPEDVEGDIEELLLEVNSIETDDPERLLKAAAYFHLNFESIHPFADGNGRVGRTLMNYYLMINNLPPTIFYEEDKNTYYMGLAVFDKTTEIEGFVQFLKEETVKTWEGRVLKRKK
ncbi:Fic family protein [Anaerovorax odorimutans]|uniref:Fic family protein n=1 Tax=Anaerovorax odorimutans TaxID=109327 RepID=A0ABT1RP56_9FIRM|nr:Fic family protein [Anaerovorax odorimutans]MCQ4636972.1 Fic family protein [Anaerovorax odorimutans]